MKKLLSNLFSVAFMLLVSSIGLKANPDLVKPADNSAEACVLQAAKSSASMSFLASKAIYKDGMSEAEFVERSFQGISGKVTPCLRDYVSHIYSFHKQGLNCGDVYEKEDGKVFSTLVQKAGEFKKNTKNATELENALVTGQVDVEPEPDPVQEKPWWIIVIKILLILAEEYL